MLAGPASATVVGARFVNVVLAWLRRYMGRSATVQSITVLLPAVTPVTVVMGDVVLVMVPGPLCTLHVPVLCSRCRVAEIVNVPLLHCSMLAPEVQ